MSEFGNSNVKDHYLEDDRQDSIKITNEYSVILV